VIECWKQEQEIMCAPESKTDHPMCLKIAAEEMGRDLYICGATFWNGIPFFDVVYISKYEGTVDPTTQLENLRKENRSVKEKLASVGGRIVETNHSIPSEGVILGTGIKMQSLM
jgi:hypothetical protein